jgi:hypothetical protein
MLTVTRLAPLQLEWAFEEPLGDDHRHSRHFVEDVNGWDNERYDRDDYDEFEDE